MTGPWAHTPATVGAVTTCVVWAVCTAAALRRERRVRGRLEALLGARRPLRRPLRWPTYGERLKRWTAPAVAALIGYVLVGGFAGCVVGGVCAYGVRRRQRRPKPAADGADTARGLPLAADLLAACLSAGASPREAAEAVGQSLGGPVGDRLARTAAELRLGGEPGEAWGAFGAIPGARALARCMERAAASGAPAAEAVSRLTAGLRAEHARAAAARAQRAQVLITAPVGLCFLPAFLTVGVVPVVVGLASGLR